MSSIEYEIDGAKWITRAVPLSWKSDEIWDESVANERRQEFRDWRLPRTDEELCP